MKKRLDAIWILILASWLLAPTPASANVGLISFTATPGADAISLAWQTGSELDTAGFRLYRADADVWQSLAVGFIPAQGTPTLGASYAAVDETAVPGVAYRYRLMEVDVQAAEQELAIVSATLPAAPTATPIVMQPPAPPTAAPDQPALPPPTDAPPTATAAAVAATPTETTAPPRSAPLVQTAATAADLTPPSNRTTSGVQIVSAAPDSSGSAAVFAPDRNRPPLQSTPENGYPLPSATPSPAADAGNPNGDAAYPAPPPTAVGGTPSPYPAGTVNGVAITPVTIIGEELPNAESASFGQENAAAEPLTMLGGRLVLWSGFLISLAILGTAVFGAIIFFTRRP